MGDLSYTRWNTLDNLNIQYTSAAGVPRTDTETFGYDNSWRIAWGAAYKATDAWKVKFGIAYDKTPTTNNDRSARVPDNDRIWFSFGGQWNGGFTARDRRRLCLPVPEGSRHQPDQGLPRRCHQQPARFLQRQRAHSRRAVLERLSRFFRQPPSALRIRLANTVISLAA